MRDGVITGKYKTINKGKAVATACGGGSLEDMAFVNMNPMFELYPAEYCLDIRVIAQHDNMVAINSAAESIGARLLSGAGGQTAFAIGANLSKGGRNITVLPSTASNGTISRIKPILDPGTIVTVPRIMADYVITEYGIARMKGKTQRQRAMEMISIAHPDFREELKKEAEKLYWP